MKHDQSRHWVPGGRAGLIEQLSQQAAGPDSDKPAWDLVIVGGGITGAGVFREATRRNLKVLLVEQKDFAWGTSGKSSKMVHGGLRYLSSGQYGLTRDSVHERQRLVTEAPGLVDPLSFLMGHYRFKFPGARTFNLLLTIYDWMAGKRNHRYVKAGEHNYLAPGLKQTALNGVTQFGDAVTDDARLVLRVLREGILEGGVAVNYLAATGVSKDNGRVTGLALRDEHSGQTFSVNCRAVVNATGAWTDELRSQLGADAVIRPLRGSHLVFPLWRLPVSCSVSFFHPQDRRPVFVFPWEGVTVAGTTDLDHPLEGMSEIAISRDEVDYLLEGVNSQFPGARVNETDAFASFAGVRPAVDTGALTPSSEKREHSIWNDHGMVSVAGGKLTTFRLIALDVLNEVANSIPGLQVDGYDATIFKDRVSSTANERVSKPVFSRLAGRYGSACHEMLSNAVDKDLERIRTTDTLWAEIDWALNNECVLCLEDLMMRRTRLGLLLPAGGESILPQLKDRCQAALGWDEQQWQLQVDSYTANWQASYSVPRQREQISRENAAAEPLARVTPATGQKMPE